MEIIVLCIMVGVILANTFIVLIRLDEHEYDTKKEFIFDLIIPYKWFISNIINKFKNLK